MAWTDWIIGQSPEDVALPEQVAEAQRARSGLARVLEAEAAGTAPTAGELAVNRAGAMAQRDLASNQRSQAAGARGFGALEANRAAAANIATGGARIAEQSGIEAGRTAAAERANARAGLANVLGQAEQSAMMAEEYRRANARPGLLSIAGTLGGAALGGYLGGAQGAGSGANLGQATGMGLERLFQ